MEPAPLVALLRYPSPFRLVDGREGQGELELSKEPSLRWGYAVGCSWDFRWGGKQRFLATRQRELPRWSEEVLRWMLDRGAGPV